MLPGDDMLDVKSGEWKGGLGQATIFATFTSFIAADAPEFIRGEEPRPRMLKEINVAR